MYDMVFFPACFALFSINKWKTELTPYGVDEISVRNVFKVCFKTTDDASVQLLLFKILHRILPVGN